MMVIKVAQMVSQTDGSRDNNIIINKIKNIVTALLAVLSSACVQVPQVPEQLPEPEPVSSLEVLPYVPEPEPVLWIYTPLAQPPANRDMVVLLPKPNGSVGAVVVHRDDGSKLLLDKAYAAAVIEGGGQTKSFKYDAAEALRDFAAARNALPARPANFLVYFREGTDQFTIESETEIERILSDLATRPAPEILVVGHTDTVGDIEYNDRLSLQRAERVRLDLIARGIDSANVVVAGRGERELLVPTSDDYPEAKNRRVEIIVR